MSKFIIVSSLPNTSAEVSGVKFQPGAGGRYFSEQVAEDVAERFKAIEGFTVVAATKSAPASTGKPDANAGGDATGDGDQAGDSQGSEADQAQVAKGKGRKA